VAPLLRLGARRPNRTGVDYHDEIAEVQVLGKDGQVLATQERGDLRRQASERLTLSVDQTPRVGDLAGFGAIRLLCGGRHDVLLGLAVSVVHVRALPRSRVLDCRHERANARTISIQSG